MGLSRWACGGGLGLLLALGACSDNGGGGSSAPISASYPTDAALSCKQVLAEITHENMVIKQANAASAQDSSTSLLNQAGNGSPVPQTEGAVADFAPTSSGETPQQLAADQTGTGAVARANALVTLGKQKKCFL